MNRKEAEDYIYKSYLKAEKYQNYNEIDANKRRPDLSKKVIEELSITDSVVVTGSKGKGSVSCMVSQILQTKMNVGLLTSPHLVNFCERFKVNGQDISDADFIKHIEIIKPIFDRIDEEIPLDVCVSPIGIQVAVALSYFNENNTDFNVLECGKGAKYDDVNNAIHQYSIINSIFLEHTRELGDTLEKIAEDKSHVISEGQKCTYIANQEAAALDVLLKRASSMGVPVKLYGRDFWAQNIVFTNKGMHFDVVIGTKVYDDITIPLLGEHQAKNCALALALCKDIIGDFDMEEVRTKLMEINWPGRMEILKSSPLIMLDACINRSSCQNVKQIIKILNIHKPIVIIGIPDDKDFVGVVETIYKDADEIVLTKSQNPHYIFTKNQLSVLKEKGIIAMRIPNIQDAIRFAEEKTKPIIILGTTSVVSEVKVLQQRNQI